MAAPARLTVDSLGAALEAFTNAPTARRVVVVSSVEIAHSAALLEFLTLQHDDYLWKLQNDFPLHKLASIDRLFRAIVFDVLPVLVADPSSPTLPLLSRYAVYIKAEAPAVGGDFEHRATSICEEMIGYADNTRRHPLRLSAADLLRRLKKFRSERVTIADSNSDSIDDRGLAAMMGLDHINVNSFRRLASLRMEVIDIDSPPPPVERRVTIDALPTSHASALLGVMQFEGGASDWVVRNLARLRALADVDVSLELVGLGLLPLLQKNPTSQRALQLLLEYVRRVRVRVVAVGGEFVRHATDMCDHLLAIGTRPLPPLEMSTLTEQLGHDLDVFRARDLCIHDSNSTDDSSDSSDAPNSTDEDALISRGDEDALEMRHLTEELHRIRGHDVFRAREDAAESTTDESTSSTDEDAANSTDEDADDSTDEDAAESTDESTADSTTDEDEDGTESTADSTTDEDEDGADSTADSTTDEDEDGADSTADSTDESSSG